MFNDIYRGKKVLVTGHTGFKGSWLSLWLHQLGARVYGLSDRIPTEPSHYEVAQLADILELDLRIDIKNRKKIEEAISDINPDVVFHLAANPIVRECYENPIDAFETNTIGTLNVLNSLRNSKNTKVAIFITSDKCYENVEWEFGYRENDLLGGKDPYSASKACAEIAFRAFYQSYFQKEKIKILTVRAGNVIGGGDWARDRIVPDMVRSWSKGEVLEIRSPLSTRPWQHVLEPLSGYLLLAQKQLDSDDIKSGEAFNFGPRPEVVQSVQELIRESSKYWKNCKFEFAKQNVDAKKEANLLKLNCDKSLFHLNWQAVLTFQETIEYTNEWYSIFYSNNKELRKFSIQQIENYALLAHERGQLWAK